MPNLGVRLQLLVGPTVPVPVSYDVIDALLEVEVTNSDSERDGFKMTFSLGRQSTASDYFLLQSGLLDAPNRATIMVFFGALPQVLINGIITRQQVVPSYQPGQSQLHIWGEDTGLELDYEEKSVVHRNMSDSTIVTKIVGGYGLVPDVTFTSEVPTEIERVTSQQGADLAFVQYLAQRNGFVFYVEPTAAPGFNKAFWGPEARTGGSQSALTFNMGADSNVEQITPGFNALESVTPKVTITEPFTRRSIPIPVPSGIVPSLAGRASKPLRTSASRDTANLNFMQAALRVLMAAKGSGDAATMSGQLDAARYGRALRARRPVDVRGVGSSYDGTWYVKQVTHRIKRGEYKQSFELRREGLGATRPTVTI